MGPSATEPGVGAGGELRSVVVPDGPSDGGFEIELAGDGTDDDDGDGDGDEVGDGVLIFLADGDGAGTSEDDLGLDAGVLALSSSPSSVGDGTGAVFEAVGAVFGDSDDEVGALAGPSAAETAEPAMATKIRARTMICRAIV